jgi:hypothetical protein
MSDFDELVPDKVARRECGGVTAMCIWRWDRDPAKLAMGWPKPVKIGRRNYRSRKALEAFKRVVFAQAARMGGGND